MELISKEDAVALIKAEMDKIRTHSLVDGTARINLRLAKNIIEDMPTLDIVRCKECKHNYNTAINHGKMQPRCDFTDWKLSENDYCSRGEREGE